MNNKKLMTVVEEDIDNSNIDEYNWDIVTRVEGRIYLFDVDHDFIAPNLTTAEYISLHGYAHKFITPKLTKVGNIDLRGYSYNLVLSNLITVGNIHVIGYEHKFIANALTHTGIISLYGYEHEFVTSNLTHTGRINGDNFMGQKIEYFDHIPCIVVSRKVKGNIEIIKAKQSKVVGGVFGGDTMYIVKQGNITAHGKTVKDATDALVYKQGSRDTAPYKSHTVDTIVSHKEAIHMYMAITGACAYGTRLFVDNNPHKKDAYSVQELIELTVGQYGHQTFKTFFRH